MIASPIFMDIEQRNSLNVLPRGAGSMAIRMARFAPMLQLHSDDQPCARPTAGKLNRIRFQTMWVMVLPYCSEGCNGYPFERNEDGDHEWWS